MEYVLSLSYGKDSIACIEAIKQLDLPLDRIIHAELWAIDTISADLPSMVAFKKQADAIIKKRYGIKVEHISVMKNGKNKLMRENFIELTKRKNGYMASRFNVEPGVISI